MHSLNLTLHKYTTVHKLKDDLCLYFGNYVCVFVSLFKICYEVNLIQDLTKLSQVL